MDMFRWTITNLKSWLLSLTTQGNKEKCSKWKKNPIFLFLHITPCSVTHARKFWINSIPDRSSSSSDNKVTDVVQVDNIQSHTGERQEEEEEDEEQVGRNEVLENDNDHDKKNKNKNKNKNNNDNDILHSLTFIWRMHHILLKRHLTNAPRNLNAPYTHAEA